MNYTLIQKFFNKDCTAGEAAQVLAYIKQHPDVVEQYLSKDEWNNLNAKTGLHEEIWTEWWTEIARKNKIKSRIVYVKKLAVAACVAGLLYAGYYLIAPQQQLPVAKTQSTPVQYKTIHNTISNKLRFALHDGSVITLNPSSSISFAVPFQHNKRDIQLDGTAYFKVAKDTSKPFTVYSGSLATTAVGTEFSVSGKNGNVIVKLFEGKVKINTVTTGAQHIQETFLMPGQQLNYSAPANTFAVNAIVPAVTKPVAAKSSIQNKSFLLTNSTLQFNSQPLPLVLDKLNDYYSTQIEYNKAEIDTISFTGTISRSDSLNVILKVIAHMNGLLINRQNDTLFIQKTTQ